MIVIPNSYGSSLREANDCHLPGGRSDGGQFCSKDGTPGVQVAALRRKTATLDRGRGPDADQGRRLTAQEIARYLPETAAEREHAAALAAAEAQVADSLQEGVTKERYAKNGRYTEARQRVHLRAMRTLENKQAPRQDQPVAIFMGGMPGAGKSMATKGLNLANKQVVNSDDVKRLLPEFEGGVGAFAVHEESTDVATRMLYVAAARRQHIVFDGTLGNLDENFEMMSFLRGQGYRIEIRYVDVPVTTSLDRVVTRFVKKGRYVPPSYVRGLARIVDGKVTSRNYRTFLTLRRFADAYALYDGTSKTIGRATQRRGRLTEAAMTTPKKIPTKKPVTRLTATEVLERAERTRTPAERREDRAFAARYVAQAKRGTP